MGGGRRWSKGRKQEGLPLDACMPIACEWQPPKGVLTKMPPGMLLAFLGRAANLRGTSARVQAPGLYMQGYACAGCHALLPSPA